MINPFTVILLVFQIIFIVLNGLLVEYGEDAQPIVSSAAENLIAKDDADVYSSLAPTTPYTTKTGRNFSEAPEEMAGGISAEDMKSPSTMSPDVKVVAENSLPTYYPMFQDVHVMMFIGFGYLMTFLKRYGFSSAGYNFLISSFVIQWATLMSGFFRLTESGTGKIFVDITTMIQADFACATVLISFGAVLGKTTPVQLIIMAFFETFFFALNEWIGVQLLQVADIGGSLFVHLFGAFFGLAVSRVLYVDRIRDHKNNSSSYQSDILALLGTIFLWMFWPSFNSALAAGGQQHRAVLNTYYSLAACCVVTFAISAAVDEKRKGEIDMVHIQNSTLAGGVAVGAIANMVIGVWGATLVGSLAAVASVVGYRYLSPCLEEKWKIHDTCGVLNLHGVPAIMAGLFSVFATLAASISNYGFGLFEVFPAMTPVADSSDFAIVEAELPGIHPGLGRSAGVQAGFQMAALTVTIAIATLSGLLVGLIINIPVLTADFEIGALYNDSMFWKDTQEEENSEILMEKPQKNEIKAEANSNDYEVEEKKGEDSKV